MPSKKIEKKYAKALFEAIKPPHTHDTMLAQLRNLEQYFKKERKIFHFLANPINDHSQKDTVANEVIDILELNPLLTKFFQLLIKRNKVLQLPGIVEEFQSLCYEHQGIAVVEIMTAVALNETTKDKLMKTLENIMKKKLILSYAINPDLIGGILAKSGSTIYDGSVKKQIELIKEKILQYE